MATEPVSSSTNEPPTVEDYVRELVHAGNRVADLADLGVWDAPIPSCPGWTALTLVRHVGGTHRWAADIVANARTGTAREMFGLTRLQRDTTLAIPEAELGDWVRTGLSALVDTLRAAPDDLDCWTFLAGPKGREFWARRQLHETGMHSIDGQLSVRPADDVAPVPAWVGSDGVDELLIGFTKLPGAQLRFEQPRTLAVHTVAPDAGDGLPPEPRTPASWLVTIGAESIDAVREPGDAALDAADASIAGTPHDVYCALWNRPTIGEVAANGDLAVIDAWHEHVQVK